MSEASESLIPAIYNFRKAFLKDGDLVRPFAAAHGVGVVEGGIFDEPSPGNYNFLLPVPSDLPRLQTARRIAVFCEDRRQFAEAAEVLGLNPTSGKDAIIGIAGGAAQPEANRFNVMAELLTNVMKHNPDSELILGVHTGVCGGVDHFTHGKMTEINILGGRDEERHEMLGYVSDLIDQLTNNGVEPDRIRPFVAVVGPNGFEGIEE